MLTNGDFLAMLSPDVLAGAVDVARKDSADSWPPLGSPSHKKRHCPSKSSCLHGPFCALPVVPMPDDSAEDWLLLLQLVHPGLTPIERPSMQWVSAGSAFGKALWTLQCGLQDMPIRCLPLLLWPLAWHVQAASKRLLPLANKYNIRGVEAQCHDALASMLSQSSNPPPAGEVLELLGIATSLGLVQLQYACRDLISSQLEKVSDDVMIMRAQGSKKVLVVADACRKLPA